MQVVGEGIGVKITKVILHKNPIRNNSIELTGGQKYLMEELGVKEGNIIEVQGSTQIPSNLSKYIDIKLRFGDKINIIKITDTTILKHIFEMTRQMFDIVPDTVKLFYKDIELRDYNKFCIKEYKLSNNDIIEVKGQFFPISLFGKQYQFLENMHMYPSTECVICLGKNDNKEYFDCGHGNVCVKCLKDYNSKELCPICINR